MLKHIPKNLSPELLKILMEMGHGDELVLADSNYPAVANAQRLVRADGLPIPELLQSILKFMPLDNYVSHPVLLMEVEARDNFLPSIWKQYEEIIINTQGPVEICAIEREDFYTRSRQAYAIVATGEEAIYANMILKKGVVKETEEESRGTNFKNGKHS